jgi:hypothetical protein
MLISSLPCEYGARLKMFGSDDHASLFFCSVIDEAKKFG